MRLPAPLISMAAALTVSAMSVTTERSVIIVGPGRAFGLALVQRFLAEGFRVGIVGKRLLNEGAFAAVRAALPADTPIATATGDAACTGFLPGALGAVARQLPPVAAVIYNVREPSSGRLAEGGREDLHRPLAVNVAGAFDAFQWAVRHASSGALPPAVIFTGGDFKDRPDPERFALSFSKAALHLLWQHLQPEAAAVGIHLATVVIHGTVGTPPGPTPEAVAEAFWLAATDRARTQWAV